ncbi:hypothetical protein B0H19DRAFT_1126487 [Mycena capillaripes]|nr:hypothetical protein B0H19DRAFT_1126487 [Mycena capillaripes]
MSDMKTSLDVLAEAACYDSHDFTRSPSPSPSPSSSRSSECGLDTPSVSPVSVCGAHQLRPRKKAHKSHKTSRIHTKPKPELKLRRKELMDRACGINTLSNSPANDCQLFVLRTVFDEITMYPTEPWLVLMAVVLHRSLRQIKNWFSNERQKNRWGEVVCTRTDVGERLRLRPAALELCEDWSDSFFEEVLMIVNYRTARRLQWERTQAMSKFITTKMTCVLDGQETSMETLDLEPVE